MWDYVCEVCADIITEQEHHTGHHNDGYLIDADRALVISVRLTHLIDRGEVRNYEKKYKKRLESMPDETCYLCHGTGKRKDMKVAHGCNSCLGKGKIRPSETQYPFSEDNVQEFATFCKYSGGFEIS